MGSFNRLRSILAYFKLRLGCCDCAGDDIVFVAGSGRSGTSWLANICNFQNSFRYIFEPLNPSQLTNEKRISWCLSSRDDAPFLRKVLAGNISNSWANSRNRRFFARRRLIKEIRSNFMLTWISAKYPSLKVVLLLRNPLEVAASRKRLEQQGGKAKWLWLPSLAELLQEPHLKSSLNQEQYERLSQQVGKGVVLETIADWCINNLLAFDLDEYPDWFVVYYEQLQVDGMQTATELMRFLEIEINDNLNAALYQRSETARGSGNTSDWRVVLTEKEIQQSLALLSFFDIGKLYTQDWKPQKTPKALNDKVTNA